MRRAPRVTLTLALTGALALVAAPAFANGAGQNVVDAPWQWYIAAGGGEWGVDEASFTEGDTSRGNAWDGSQMVFLGPDYLEVSSAALEPAIPADYVPFECITSTLSASGDDQVVTCNDTVTTPWGLSVTSNVRVLAPGDLARITFFVTNTTNAPVALGYRYSWNYGESRVHVRSTEPTTAQLTVGENDGLLASPDVWSFNGGDGTLNAGVAWGITGQPFFATTPTHDGYDNAAVELLPNAGRTIAAGETVAIAFFHILGAPTVFIDDPEEASAPVESAEVPAAAEAAEPTETTETAQPAETVDGVEPAAVPQPAITDEPTNIAAVMAEFASFDGRLTRGLPEDVLVGNWQPAAVPELAQTGIESEQSLLIGGVAMTLLVAGASVLFARRASARSDRR